MKWFLLTMISLVFLIILSLLLSEPAYAHRHFYFDVWIGPPLRETPPPAYHRDRHPPYPRYDYYYNHTTPKPWPDLDTGPLGVALEPLLWLLGRVWIPGNWRRGYDPWTFWLSLLFYGHLIIGCSSFFHDCINGNKTNGFLDSFILKEGRFQNFYPFRISEDVLKISISNPYLFSRFRSLYIQKPILPEAFL